MKNKVIRATLIIFIAFVFIFIAVKITLGKMEKNLENLKALAISDIDVTRLSDGTFNGSYKAFPIEAEVAVVIENKRIKSINLLKHRNGNGTAAEAITGIVTEAQSLKVDAVSGATYSSKVILKAIENALAKAVK